MDVQPAGLPREPRDCAGAAAELVYLDIRVPVRLRDAVERHYSHLAALASTLRLAGMDETAIRSSLDTLIDEYRAELLAAIGATTWETIHG